MCVYLDNAVIFEKYMYKFYRSEKKKYKKITLSTENVSDAMPSFIFSDNGKLQIVNIHRKI